MAHSRPHGVGVRLPTTAAAGSRASTPGSPRANRTSGGSGVARRRPGNGVAARQHREAEPCGAGAHGRCRRREVAAGEAAPHARRQLRRERRVAQRRRGVEIGLQQGRDRRLVEALGEGEHQVGIHTGAVARDPPAVTPGT
ncbi:MAG: hypothetical protein U1E73_06905 [Planctomycetota bacterium]